jgi:ribosomal protein S18 acetylase RimI-like enzyme
MEDNIKLIIREYKKEDKNTIRKIACDSALMGKPCEIFFQGRDFLADILTLYFTDYEPQSCFVAEVDNKVVGYLTGCKNTKNLTKVFILKIIPRLIFKFFFQGIIFRKKNLIFFLNLIKSFFKGEFKSPNLNLNKNYPALLHINIDENYRKMNIGTKLIEKYLNYLKSQNVPGVHLNAKSKHASIFFEKMGFYKVFEIKRTYFFYLLNEPFIYYYYTKKIA